MKLRKIIGAVKDKVSQSKAAALSSSLHLAVLRATTHAASAPPDDRHIAALLSLGDSSRGTASGVIESLMDRLHCTKDSSVALKCLLTIHHVIRRGPFILQDQLSIFPATGGRNYLNLSGFRDSSSSATWALSAWVRYYARYLETLLCTSRSLGFFLSSYSCTQEKEILEQRISTITNKDLNRDVVSLVTLLEEICNVPDNILVERNKLLYEVRGFLTSDYLSAVNELSLRLSEFKERLNSLSFGDSFELMCTLDRLENCKAKVNDIFTIKKASSEMLWGMIEDLRDKIGVCRDKRNLISLGRSQKGTESARFGGRVKEIADSVQFSSSRFELDKVSFEVLE